MQSKKGIVFLLMVWLTVLTVWAVNSITTSFGYSRSVNVQGIPVQPAPRNISIVPMDKDTVWVIEPNNQTIQVITHDNDGFHLTLSTMSVENRRVP